MDRREPQSASSALVGEVKRATPRCDLCCYYAVPHEGSKLGSCRRSAPSPSDGWPLVNVADWCADWQGTDGEGWVTWHMRKMRESIS
jgi:hypothetical protein